MNADALLLDMGGVVLEIDFGRVFARWAEIAGADAAQVGRRFTHDAAYRAHERGEIGAPAYFESLRGSLGLDLDDAAFEDGWQRIFVAEIAPTVALLRRLREHVPLYLFSNTNRLHHACWASRYRDALAPFRRHFVSSEMGLRKPEREAFAYVAREMGVAPARILFFDDTPENVEGARAAGLQAVHVTSPADVERAVRPWIG